MNRFLPFFVIWLFFTPAVFAHNIDIKDGKLRLVIEDYDGSFYLYRKNEQGVYVSLLDSKRYSQNSGFYVLFDKGVQKLTKSGGVRINSEETSAGARVTFTAEDKFVCTVDFTFLASDGKESDSLRLDAALTNISAETRMLGLKVFFDTWLGENSGRHFSSALRSSIASECYFNDMSIDKWIQSSNDEVAVRFLFAGEGITPVQTLALANKDVLSVPVWTPAFVPERKFDSLQSYNNSALSTVWQPQYTDTGSSVQVRFYISTGAGRIIPADFTALQAASAGRNDTDAYSNSQDIFKALPPPVDLLRDDLDAYIRFLLERVRELEKNPSTASREEILKLSAEMDALLLKAGR